MIVSYGTHKCAYCNKEFEARAEIRTRLNGVSAVHYFDIDAKIAWSEVTSDGGLIGNCPYCHEENVWQDADGSEDILWSNTPEVS